MPDPTPQVVAVAPTSTTVVSLDVRQDALVTVQVQNLEAGQTFSGAVHRRMGDGLTWSTSTLPDFASISPAGTVDGDGNPLDSVTADLDVRGTAELRLVGLMSGAGGNVRVSVRRAGPK